jgi:hypothetical protein
MLKTKFFGTTQRADRALDPKAYKASYKHLEQVIEKCEESQHDEECMLEWRVTETVTIDTENGTIDLDPKPCLLVRVTILWKSSLWPKYIRTFQIVLQGHNWRLDDNGSPKYYGNDQDKEELVEHILEKVYY